MKSTDTDPGKVTLAKARSVQAPNDTKRLIYEQIIDECLSIYRPRIVAISAVSLANYKVTARDENSGETKSV